MKKKILLILIMLLFIPLSFSCSKEDRTIYESGDFRYRIIKENGEKMAAIKDFSDEAYYNKEAVVIPEYLDGYKVYGMYDKGYKTTWGRLSNSGKTHKIFITFEMQYKTESMRGHNVLFFRTGVSERAKGGSGDFFTYLPSNEKAVSRLGTIVYNANVTYYVDGEIYWIDDYDNSLITYIPEDPIKEGHTFKGWYKDEQYTQRWNFSKDIVPKKDITYPNKPDTFPFIYNYQETKLYAKFEEISK